MNTSPFFNTKNHAQLGVATALLALGALSCPALADPPYSMAPPVQSSNVQDVDDAPGNASQDSVFNWAEVPENQQVPVRRAVFDRGGYQLYDTAGETIVVPFADQNLYVMKFGISDNGSTYFVNTGETPVLYLPRGGSLENASVPGARWYPFSEDFRPAEPVFLGIAPSYDDFIGMGWYPDMYAYGGYYGRRSFIAGGIFLPTIGLSFVIGGHSYDGWRPYHHYYDFHPAPYRVTIINRNVYHEDNWHHGDFHGAGHSPYQGRGYGTHPGFGGGHPVAGRTFSGHPFDGGRNSDGLHGNNGQWAHRTFRGTGHTESIHTNTPDHSFNSDRSSGERHTFQGTQTGGNAERNFGANHSDSDHGNRPAFNGGTNRPAFNNDTSRPAFNGGNRPASNGADRQTASDSGRQHSAQNDGGRRGGDGGGHSSDHDHSNDNRR